MPDVAPGTIEFILSWLIDNYGQGGTLFIFFGIGLLWFLMRLYTDWRKDKEIHLALAEKEKTVNRLANDNRELRAMFLKDALGWSNDDIVELIISNDFSTPKELRDHCEKRKTKKGRDKK